MVGQDDSQLDGSIASSQDEQPVEASQQANQPSAPVTTGQPDAGVANSDTASSQDEQPDRDEVAAKREAGALAQAQRELAEYKKNLSDKDRDLERLRNIEKVAISSPDNYFDALVKYNGLDRAQAAAEVERLKGQGAWGGAVAPQQAQPVAVPQPVVDPYQAAQQVIDNREIQSKFFEAIPELDPSRIAPERIDRVKSLTAAVEYEARRTLAASGNTNPTPSQLVAELVTTYKDFTGRTDEQLQEARNEGRIEGIAQSTVVRAGSTAATKSYTPRPSSVGLSTDELEQAKNEGYTPEEWLALKDPIAKVK